MTDNEIVKALKCISGKAEDWDCDKCAFDGAICTSFVAEKALDLINRLQAENEKKDRAFEELIKVARLWKEKYDNAKKELFGKTEQLKTAKAEAYKECIDKIQNQIKRNNAISAEWLRKYLDNLLKNGGEDNG
jgi:lysyl-tRNA synthetase class I